MTAFDQLTAAILADPHLSLAARYRPAEGLPVDLRVRRVVPTEIDLVLGQRVATPTAQFELARADVARPAAGDRIEIDGTVHIVQGEPVLDPTGTAWRVEAPPA